MAQRLGWTRKWADRQNAAGFAAACARLALPFYIGDHRSKIVSAIEIAEKFAPGKQIESAAYAVADAAYAVAVYADYCRVSYAAARASAYAAYTAIIVIHATAATNANNAAYWTDKAGVDSSEIAVLYARWTIRDLACGKVDEEIRLAAGAAIVAGDENLARELLAR